eukprot:TRINITY_DN1215_c1_g1_i1.p1 TRINITY_DN1215_c1_g1~~TRINITY_DN1215_c1_g1_i1.p1  ORF type:complete len:212 (-),score=63.91 TRINITY_DN1215_c1_g1_i1:51-686(-)
MDYFIILGSTLSIILIYFIFFKSKNTKKNTNKNTEINQKFKCVTVGDFGVGKTSLISRCVDNRFCETTTTTTTTTKKIETKSLSIFTENENKKIIINFEDTLGMEKDGNISQSYVHSSSIILLMFDLSNHESFEQLQNWFKWIQPIIAKNTIIFLIGNKLDLNENFDKSKISNFTEKNSIDSFFEISCKENLNIQQLKKALEEKITSNFIK